MSFRSIVKEKSNYLVEKTKLDNFDFYENFEDRFKYRYEQLEEFMEQNSWIFKNGTYSYYYLNKLDSLDESDDYNPRALFYSILILLFDHQLFTGIRTKKNTKTYEDEESSDEWNNLIKKYINYAKSDSTNSSINEVDDFNNIEMVIREMVIFGKANELEHKGDQLDKLVSNLQNNLTRITPGLHQNFYNQPHILNAIQLLIEESDNYITDQNIPQSDPYLLLFIQNKLRNNKTL